MSDNELKHKLLNVSGNEDIIKSDNILSEYNNLLIHLSLVQNMLIVM